MELFRYNTNMLQRFLTELQAEKPMMAFLSSALGKKMQNLCQINLKNSILNEATIASLLTQVDMKKKENKLSFNSVKLGTKLKQMLTREESCCLTREKEIDWWIDFKMDCDLTVLQILKNLKKGSLLNYSVVWNTSSLDLSEIVANKGCCSHAQIQQP